MSTESETLRHPINGTPEETWEGFSWPALFFGVIWLLVKGLYGHFLISLILLIVSAGFAAPIVWIVYGFIGNDAHKNSLLKKGYLSEYEWEIRNRPAPVVKADAPATVGSVAAAATPVLVANALGKLSLLLEKGHLTYDEFTEQKQRLLGSPAQSC